MPFVRGWREKTGEPGDPLPEAEFWCCCSCPQNYKGERLAAVKMAVVALVAGVEGVGEEG